MTVAFRITGIIVCSALVIVSLIALQPAPTGLAQTEGTQFGIAFAGQSREPASDEEIDQAIEVLTERLKRLGVSGAIVERSNGPRESIKVLLPPGTDVERVRSLINDLWLLDLKFVARETEVPYKTAEEAEAAAKNLTGCEVLRYTSRDGEKSGWVVVEKTPVITGQDVVEAEALSAEHGGGNYDIGFTLKPDAAKRFSRATAENLGRQLAIVLNDEVRSAPTIQSEINDRGQISGGFTKRAAEDLAIMLGSGAPHRALQIVTQQPVDGSRWRRAHKSSQ
jgi:preprotein translocase subunit SecD